MGEISIKRAYEAPSASDGRRVLVDRLWPRGVSRAEARLDDWLFAERRDERRVANPVEHPARA